MVGAPQPDCAREEKPTSQELEMTSTILDKERSFQWEIEAKVVRLIEQLQDAEEMILQLKAVSEVTETTSFDAVSFNI